MKSSGEGGLLLHRVLFFPHYSLLAGDSDGGSGFTEVTRRGGCAHHGGSDRKGSLQQQLPFQVLSPRRVSSQQRRNQSVPTTMSRNGDELHGEDDGGHQRQPRGNRARRRSGRDTDSSTTTSSRRQLDGDERE